MKDYNFCIFRVLGNDLSRYLNITKDFTVEVFTEPFLWYLERGGYTLDRLKLLSIDDLKKMIIDLDKNEKVYAYESTKTGISRPEVFEICEGSGMLISYNTEDDAWYEACAKYAYNKIHKTDK